MMPLLLPLPAAAGAAPLHAGALRWAVGPLAYWVDTLDPFLGPHWGAFGLRYYGLGYALGFLAGAALLRQYDRAGRSLLPADRIPDLMVALVCGVLLGGRIGSYLLYDGWRSFGTDPLAIFRVWEGGMASHGGILGVVLAIAWFARNQRIPFTHLGDLVASAAPPGLLAVRIANFINGELWGKVADVRWAVIFPRSAPPGTPLELIAPRHPSQLYEAALEGALLLAYLQWRFWRTDVVRRHPGRLAGEFLLGYAVVRAIGERFREPDASLILGLSRGTFYSVALAAFGLFLIFRPVRPLDLAAARAPKPSLR
jgi:phosphatidylglycerol:prolipoprotein diacylglycerol transferase